MTENKSKAQIDPMFAAWENKLKSLKLVYWNTVARRDMSEKKERIRLTQLTSKGG